MLSYIIKYTSLKLCVVLIALAISTHATAQQTDQISNLKNAVANAKNDTERVHLLIKLSDAILCNDATSSKQYAHQALLLSKKINLPIGIIGGYNALGTVSQKCLNDKPAAIVYFDSELLAAIEFKNLEGQLTSLKNLGHVYQLMAQYGKALNYYKRTLALAPDADNTMVILGNMGAIYASVADYRNALMYYDSSLNVLNTSIKAKKTANLDDTAQMGALLVTIADLYISMEQYGKAHEKYNRVLAISENSQLSILTICALKGIGNAYHYQKDLSNATEYYTRALQEAQRSHESVEQAIILNDLANIYLETGDVANALTHAENSLKLAQEKKRPELLPASYITLGKVYTVTKKYNEAVAYLKKAIDMSKESGAQDIEKNALQALSNTYEQMNQPALALAAHKEYDAIRDSIYNVRTANEFTRLDMQYSYATDSLKHADEYTLKMQKQRVFTYTGFAGLVAVLLLSFFIYRNYSHEKKANLAISKANEVMNDEKQRSEALLLNILPEDVARELKSNGNVQAKMFDHVTVLFTDFVNFTEAGERLSTEELVAELHTCFMAFDRIMGKYNIEKIKTVGDAYLAVSGLPHPNPEHASEIVHAALECRDFMVARKKKLGDRTFSMRIGVNSGTVVAGIVGVKKFAYDIWGDTVNTAARMEQYSEPDRINISQTTYDLVKNDFTCIDRGEIDAKHKGKMQMYFVES